MLVPTNCFKYNAIAQHYFRKKGYLRESITTHFLFARVVRNCHSRGLNSQGNYTHQRALGLKYKDLTRFWLGGDFNWLDTPIRIDITF